VEGLVVAAPPAKIQLRVMDPRQDKPLIPFRVEIGAMLLLQRKILQNF
jgi:hypothetical protein